MAYSKIFKFIALIIVILFFSYLNSTRDVNNDVNEGFTSNYKEYYNKRKRDLRHTMEDFKTKTSNTVDKIYKKYNPI